MLQSSCAQHGEVAEMASLPKALPATRTVRPYAIFLCVCCLWLCVGMNNACVAWTLKDIAASQMLDLRQEGFLASGFAMGYCIGPVITGILLDKLGRRPTLILCASLPVLCQAAVATLAKVPYLARAPGSWSFTMALAHLRCCQAICSGGAIIGGKVYLNEIMPMKCRDAMLCIVHIQLQLGGMALTICALFWPKWQQLHAILVVPGVVTALLMLSPTFCPESLESPEDIPSKPFRSLLQPPMRKILLVLVANQFFHRLCQQGNDAWGMKFLQTISKRETRTVISNVKFVCKILGGLLAASASKHLGTLAALLGGYMTCAVGTFLFTITELKMSLAVAWGVASLGEEVSNVLALTTLVQAFPSQLRGRGVSLVCVPIALASIAAGSVGALSAYDASATWQSNSRF